VIFTEAPIPITLMNGEAEETAAIIGEVVERCGNEGIALTQVSTPCTPLLATIWAKEIGAQPNAELRGPRGADAERLL
jgi:hypothetical protein